MTPDITVFAKSLRDRDHLADKLRRRRDTQGSARRADPGTNGGPDRPGGVHTRHEGASGGPLDSGTFEVDQHVEGA